VVPFKRGYCKVFPARREAQRAFRYRFNLAPLAHVPDRKSIVSWVTTFRQTASATKRWTGIPRPVRSPKNIEAVRASILQSPRRSASKHGSAFGLSDRSVRRILHDDLHFHPYKMAIVQELSERNLFWRNTFQSALSHKYFPMPKIVFNEFWRNNIMLPHPV